MTDYYYVWDEAQPFFLPGSSTAILLLHGFTASPSELKALGLLLHEKGYTVSAPLLPGHGSQPRHLNGTTRQRWQDAVTMELEVLRSSHRQVVVVGLSMGGLLALWCMEQGYPVTGVVAINPALEFKSRWALLAYPLSKTMGYVRKGNRSINEELERQGRFAYDVIPVKAFYQLDQLRKQVWKDIAQLHNPVLIIQAQEDEMINARAVADFYQQAPAADKTYLELTQSGHVATMGPEKELISDTIDQAVRRWTQTEED